MGQGPKTAPVRLAVDLSPAFTPENEPEAEPKTAHTGSTPTMTFLSTLKAAALSAAMIVSVALPSA
ncbi:hypothetical protein EN788_68195, partial [Mesorhizobium sp. M2D.F.Ca.ET.145.01.1.1]